MVVLSSFMFCPAPPLIYSLVAHAVFYLTSTQTSKAVTL